MNFSYVARTFLSRYPSPPSFTLFPVPSQRLVPEAVLPPRHPTITEASGHAESIELNILLPRLQIAGHYEPRLRRARAVKLNTNLIFGG